MRAAVRRKTLLLLWWIDGGMEVVVRGTLARQGLPQGYGDTHVYGGSGLSSFQPSNPFLRMPWASFYRLRGHHSGKVVIVH